MSRYKSREDLAAHVAWEGGVIGAILDYGISHNTLPEGTPLHIWDAWTRVEAISVDVDMIQDWLESEWCFATEP